jgi:hypothetical protein
LIRPRPVIPVRIAASGGSQLLDGLLDTGSDEIVFEDWVARPLGIDLAQAPTEPVNLVGRGAIDCRYATVALVLTDGRETCRWSVLVGFVPIKLQYQLLGHAGCLEHFDVEFRGADREVVLTANRSFAGSRS